VTVFATMAKRVTIALFLSTTALVCCPTRAVALTDTFAFIDVTDVVTLDTTAPQSRYNISINDVEAEILIVDLFPPAVGVTVVAVTPGLVRDPTGAGGGGDILEPCTPPCSPAISDFIFVDEPQPPVVLQAVVAFVSDSEEGLNPSPPPGLTMTEDGTLQTVGTIVWSDGTVDTIQFRSDVPEPSSLLLLLSGTVAVFVAAGSRRRNT